MLLDVAIATPAWVRSLIKSLCMSSWFDVIEVLFWAGGKYETIRMSDVSFQELRMTHKHL